MALAVMLTHLKRLLDVVFENMLSFDNPLKPDKLRNELISLLTVIVMYFSKTNLKVILYSYLILKKMNERITGS